MDEKANDHQGSVSPAKSDQAVHNQSPPDFDDYWAHRIAENAKKKVIAYFGVLGLVVSIVVTLFGADRIRSLIDEQYVQKIEKQQKQASSQVEALFAKFEKRLNEKEVEATNNIEHLSDDFESKLQSLQSRVETRANEFHALVGLTITQVRSAGSDTSTLTVDLTNTIGPIRDQGREGTTVAFALAYALHSELKRERGEEVTLSARSIYVEAQKKDEWPGENYEGTSLVGGLKALKEVGAYNESDWPYAQPAPSNSTGPQYRIKDYTLIPKDRIDLILASLRQGKTVPTTIRAPQEISNVGANGKLILGENPQTIGGHVICIVGYSAVTEEFKFANMWGKKWGEDGFGYITKKDLEKIILGAATFKLQDE